jgi:hypothetical protein
MDLWCSLASQSVTVNIRFYNSSSVLQATQAFTAALVNTQWHRIAFNGQKLSGYTKVKIEIVDQVSSIHNIVVKDIQFEDHAAPTAYTPNATTRTVSNGLKYSLASYCPRFPTDGFTVLCWTPHPDLAANPASSAPHGLFSLGLTGQDFGSAGEHRAGILYTNQANTVSMKIRGATFGVTEARSGTTWRLMGLMYRPSVPATPWAFIVGGTIVSSQSAIAANNCDPAQFSNLFVGAEYYNVNMQNSLYAAMDELMFFPYEISTDFLAFLNARTVGFGGAFPKAVLSGDVVNGKSIVVLGQAKSDDNIPHTIGGVWKNNAKSLEFTLTEV